MTAADVSLITNLLGRYCHLVDSEPISTVVEVFWDDATLIAPDRGEHVGREAILAWCEEWDRTMRAPVSELRHRITSPAIAVSGTTADALTYFDADAVAGHRHINLRGRYVDHLERRGDEWRFARRQIEVWTPSPRTEPQDGR